MCGPAFCRQYGPVRDVRIPCQERRMFGFVSFQNPETVSTILMRRNPHFICGARVLVNPTGRNPGAWNGNAACLMYGSQKKLINKLDIICFFFLSFSIACYYYIYV